MALLASDFNGLKAAINRLVVAQATELPVDADVIYQAGQSAAILGFTKTVGEFQVRMQNNPVSTLLALSNFLGSEILTVQQELADALAGPDIVPVPGPDSINNLVVWLHADDNVVTDGNGFVTSWGNKVANGFNFTPYLSPIAGRNVSAGPIVGTATGPQGTLRMDGSAGTATLFCDVGSTFGGGLFPEDPVNASIFSVVSWDKDITDATSNPYPRVISLRDSNAAVDYTTAGSWVAQYFNSAASAQGNFETYRNGIIIRSTPADTDIWHNLAVRASFGTGGDSLVMNHDDGPNLVGLASGNVPITADLFQIGGDAPADVSGTSFTGNILEIVAYNRKLTDLEFAVIQTYFITKFGLS